MGNVVRLGVGVAVLAVATGCASKDWVRQVVSEQQTQVDQRFAKVEDRLGSEGQRITTAEGRITEGEGKLTETVQRVEGMGFRVATVEQAATEAGVTATTARARADEAFSRADAAGTRADEVDARLTRLWSNRHARNRVDRVDVQFRFNQAELDDGAQTSLLTLIRELQQNPKLTVDLEGYTDPTGAREYNLRLSQRRVEAVRRYLVEKGIELPRINAVGLGPLPDRAVPAEKKRRVTVNVMLSAD
jgi:outer membrane protein OmpA-like peptidoglycan-associated protein